MSYSDFRITNCSSLKKTLDSLVEKKLISFSHTFKDNGHRGMNEYRILQPKKYMDKFIFITSKNSDKEKTKEIEIEEEDNPWEGA